MPAMLSTRTPRHGARPTERTRLPLCAPETRQPHPGVASPSLSRSGLQAAGSVRQGRGRPTRPGPRICRFQYRRGLTPELGIRQTLLQGGTSFLRGQTFRLSPDLTCIIGGSMTGKSTLLDGLRLTFGGEQAMPDRATTVGRDALARARDRFLSGGTLVEMESPAGDLARPVAERFAPRFFSQGELEVPGQRRRGYRASAVPSRPRVWRRAFGSARCAPGSGSAPCRCGAPTDPYPGAGGGGRTGVAAHRRSP